MLQLKVRRIYAASAVQVKFVSADLACLVR
jgi:hypothetical protein